MRGYKRHVDVLVVAVTVYSLFLLWQPIVAQLVLETSYGSDGVPTIPASVGGATTGAGSTATILPEEVQRCTTTSTLI